MDIGIVLQAGKERKYEDFYYGGEVEDAMQFIARCGGVDDFFLLNLRRGIIDMIETLLVEQEAERAVGVIHMDNAEQINGEILDLLCTMRSAGWIINLCIGTKVL